MAAIDFNTLAQGWNQIRSSGAPGLKAAVSGLVDPSRIIIQRVADTPSSMTIMFTGIDTALENPDRDRPMMNRALFAWVRKFAEAQIVRGGDPDTFTILIRKPETPQQSPAPQPPVQESRHSGDLVRISNVRNVDG